MRVSQDIIQQRELALDGIEGNANFDVVVSIDGKWNVEGGNTAGMDIMQAHPDLDLVFAANDYMIIGASYAAKALGRSDLVLLGNDGDTSGLEEIAAGNITATVNTSPFLMGKAAMSATLDALAVPIQVAGLKPPPL